MDKGLLLHLTPSLYRRGKTEAPKGEWLAQVGTGLGPRTPGSQFQGFSAAPQNLSDLLLKKKKKTDFL